jgi:hypothetical protein
MVARIRHISIESSTVCLGTVLALHRRMARTTLRTPQQTEREPGTREDGEAMPPGAIDPRPDDPAKDPSQLDDPMAGSPDREPGKDHPRQRPMTDNKAGG